MANGGHDTERSAEKSRGEFSAQFFPRIKRGPEIARLVAAKADLVARPVRIMPISA
jgi:hypothetical protein